MPTFKIQFSGFMGKWEYLPFLCECCKYLLINKQSFKCKSCVTFDLQNDFAPRENHFEC